MMTQFFTCYILGGNKLFDKLSDKTKKRKEKQEAKVKEVAALFFLEFIYLVIGQKNGTFGFLNPFGIFFFFFLRFWKCD